MHEQTHSGIDAVHAITALLQRIRNAHPTQGLYQAGEVEFWWGRPRRTDNMDQIVWYDDEGRPEAAAAFYDFANKTSLVYTEVTFCPFTMPGASQELVAEVVARGLAHAAAHGFESVELEVGHEDDHMQSLMTERGFTVTIQEVLVECTMPAETEPEISPLADGYRLVSRSEVGDVPHHMAGDTGAEFEQRLRQLSLYRADLDLVVLTEADEPAGHGMFWHDPVTGVGVVEPMRTHDDHQQRGLARHILTSGVARLREAGSARVSIGYEPDNPASGHLYRSVGFEPQGGTALYSGPTT